MIPSTNKKLLVAEDWKKIYQTIESADFQSYDFDTLRRVAVSYLRQSYPEDFNDYIDSSEFVAMIDLLAFLGQNLSFRIDLNARENFLETATRRDSILRLAQLISYSPSRNKPANGFLKITAISTTDNVIDANGVNLSNSVVGWNDPTNSNWYQQFITIMNSAMPSSVEFGKPLDAATISGITHQQYRINTVNTDVPIFGFQKSINGTLMPFEIVSSLFANKTYVYEEPPLPGNNFSFIFTNDNKGSGSANTGFFIHFRQGTLNYTDFNIGIPMANELIGINANNINDSDVWLWQQSGSGNYDNLWTKVDATSGNNVIYNALENYIRQIYSVSTRDNDQIDLNFADGNFGDLPRGNFRLFYRQSNALSYSITPEQISGISVNIPYYNKNGQQNTMTLILTLQYTVSNSSGPETAASIKTNAPQNYYLQNRLITGEDYNIAPALFGVNVLKSKAINRVSSGISKFFELNDISGKYSRTEIFCTDGVIFKEESQPLLNFSFTTRNELYGVLKNTIEPIVITPSFKNFYLEKFPRPNLSSLSLSWISVNAYGNQTRGYFINNYSTPQQVGYFSSNNCQYITAGALIKFVAPTLNGAPQYFKPNGQLTLTADATTTDHKWVKVTQVVGDGANSGKGKLNDGTGPIILTDKVPNGAVPAEIIPVFTTTWSYALEQQIVNLGLIQRNFGISFDRVQRSWFIIVDTNLNLNGPFDLTYQADSSNSNKDASWQVAFQWTGNSYNVLYRTVDYIFQSVQETGFYIDETRQNYDFITSNLIKDKISVLGINTAPDQSSYVPLGHDYNWQIDSAIVEPDGYVDPAKVKISFFDSNNDGQIDDPDAFVQIAAPDALNSDGYQYNFVFFKKLSDGLRYQLVDNSKLNILSYPSQTSVSEPVDGQFYYFYNPNVIQSWSDSLKTYVLQPGYFAKPGRSGLKFHYQHNSGEERRLDPSPMNIIDLYVLSSEYDTAYRNWLQKGIGTKPQEPTSNALEEIFASYVEPVKSISDTVIYHPATYKILFGDKAEPALQATFKAVQNPTVSISSNKIASDILAAINDFFAIENWDFGQSFNFSELATYVMNVMSPYILNFVVVPKSNTVFGSLYEIAAQSNEIFISGAKLTDIVVIDSLTASQLNTTATITINTIGF